MLPSSRSSRWAASAAGILAASVLSVAAARGHYKPYAADAPPYRQLGGAAAKVQIVEYSDFQCPACSAAHKSVKQVLAAYGEKTRVTFKHFPLEKAHPFARAAAVAAECAGRQGKFWDYHDVLFERQKEWAPRHEEGKPAEPEKAPSEWFAAYAAQVRLDKAAFAACLADPAANAAIDADLEEGRNLPVGATPTFFVAGKRFVGGRQLATLGTLWIDKKLKNP